MNPKNKSFSWRQRLGSFKHAWQGITTLVRQEHNARIHLGASILVIGFASFLSLSPIEWVVIIACMAAVWMAELFNTAIEALCNRVSPEQHPLIKCAKDCAAGGVLVASLAALAIGVIIFIPKLIALFS